MMKKSIGSGRGSVYNVLLKALQSGDKYAYEICKEIEEKTHGDYILKEQSSYSGLRRLEQRNEITSYWKDSELGGRRHYYSLTEKGRQRLENSNFTWEDTRDEIVDTLFEKSDIDKKIEEVSEDIKDIKNSTFSEETQNMIDEVINNTENLQTDLFSIFSNQNIENSTDKKIDEDENAIKDDSIHEDEDVENIENLENFDKEISKNTENQIEENKEKVEDSSPESNELFDLFSTQHSNEIDNGQDVQFENENEENQQTLRDNEEINENETNNIDDKLETQKENENAIENKDEVKEAEIQSKNNNDFDENNQIEDKKTENFDDLMKNLQTISDENSVVENDKEDVLEDDKENAENKQLLEKNTEDIDFYRQLHKSSNNYIDETYTEKSNMSFYGNLENDAINDKNDNILSSNVDFEKELNDNSNEIHSIDDYKNIEENNSFDLQNSNKVEESINQNENYSKTIDYKNIFGDLVSDNNEKTFVLQNVEEKSDFSTFESNGSMIENVKNFEESNSNDFLANYNDNFEKNNLDELNQVNNIKDINRTLISNEKSHFDEIYEMQNSYNNFSQNDENDNFESYQSEQIDTIHNVSFDRKYNNLENKLEMPSYKVRYHKKAQSKKNSKFVLSNKLNLISNVVLCFLLTICNAITLLICKSLGSPNEQIIFCQITFGFVGACLIVSFVLYLLNPTKRKYKINNYDLIVAITLSVIIFTLTITLNLHFGLTLDNFAKYLATLVVPLFFAIALTLSHFIKKLLSKLSIFYK